jgi:hypothetical protein
MGVVDLSRDILKVEEIALMHEKLKTDDPPLSLSETRQQKREKEIASKEDRRKAVEFIRSRTTSRASALGRPFLSNSGESHDG